MHLCFRYIEDK